MAKLQRLRDYMDLGTLTQDIEVAERILKKNVVGEHRITAAMLAGVKANFIATASSLFREAIYEKYEEHKMLRGERPAEDPSDWDAGADEAIEEAAKPHIDVLSQSWLGTETIDTRLHEEGELGRLANSFAKEAFKQITDKIAGEDILAALGLETSAFQYLGGAEKLQANEAAESRTWQEAVRRIAVASGGHFDPIEVYDFLDNATDMDDGLAFGALASLFKSEPSEDITLYVRALQGFRKANGKEAPSMLSDLILKEITNPAPELSENTEPKEVPKPSERAPKAKKAAAPKPKKEEAVSTEGPIPAVKLARIQRALGCDDTQMGKLVGVSRQSWCNYASGKRSYALTDSVKAKLREALEAKTREVVAAGMEFE